MSDYDEYTVRKRDVAKWSLFGLLAVVVLMILGTALGLFGDVLQGERDERANPAREKSVLFDPNNSIGTYESFYDRCRAVVALNGKIVNAQSELESRVEGYNPELDSFGQEQRAIAGLRGVVRGLQNQQIDIAEGYNADSSKTTRAQFKAADLPYTIDAPYDNVQCGEPKEAGR